MAIKWGACYHEVCVHHVYTISGARGPQGPRAQLSAQTHRVSEQASVQGLLQVHPIMEYTFTTGTPYLGPAAPKGPGPTGGPGPGPGTSGQGPTSLPDSR